MALAGFSQDIFDANLHHTAMGITETLCLAHFNSAWFWQQGQVNDPYGYLQSQQRLLFAIPHMTSLEAACVLLNQHRPVHVVFAVPHNTAFAAWQRQARTPHVASLVNRDHVRHMIRILQRGETLMIAPDQYVTRNHGGIASTFFGQDVLTTNSTARLAKLGKAQIVPVIPYRDLDSHTWRVEICQALATQAEDDETRITQMLNHAFEKAIRKSPEQYFWMHRRFRF